MGTETKEENRMNFHILLWKSDKKLCRFQPSIVSSLWAWNVHTEILWIKNREWRKNQHNHTNTIIPTHSKYQHNQISITFEEKTEIYTCVSRDFFDFQRKMRLCWCFLLNTQKLSTSTMCVFSNSVTMLETSEGSVSVQLNRNRLSSPSLSLHHSS
jgi:hypothetical protein